MYQPDGILQSRFASGAPLNAPWGMALAPADFGTFSNDLLVGNFGDGTINAFDPATGTYLGSLGDSSGQAIAIGDLWGLSFGNGLFGQAPLPIRQLRVRASAQIFTTCSVFSQIGPAD